MAFKIATWNINSVRLRLGLVERFLKEHRPDVLCLQETKCPQGQFPVSALQKAGYRHIVEYGQKGYHGVAVVSRLPVLEQSERKFCGKEDCRHVSVTIGEREPVIIHNLYVPAGGDEPNPSINDKFAHKLSFLDELEIWFRQGAVRAGHHGIVVGDLNIAPLENDVWSHKELLKVVSHTPVETEGLERARKAGSWVDLTRHRVPDSEKVYTWWSYRAKDWAASDRGRRLDHLWVTESLAPACRTVTILRDARGWPQPSDHVPVMGLFDLKI